MMWEVSMLLFSDDWVEPRKVPNNRTWSVAAQVDTWLVETHCLLTCTSARWQGVGICVLAEVAVIRGQFSPFLLQCSERGSARCVCVCVCVQA